MADLPKNISDRDHFSYVESPTRDEGTAKEVVIGGEFVPFGKFDEIFVTYPTNTTEVFTYRLLNSDIGTITVTYTNNSKNNLLSVVYNDLQI